MAKWQPWAGIALFISALLAPVVLWATTPLEVQRLNAKLQQNLNQQQHVIINHPNVRQTNVVYTRMLATPEPRLLNNTLYSGSLHDNIARLAASYGWRTVVWNVPNDYLWVGRTRLSGNSFPNMLSQVLKDYPLQAIFYQGNHVLVIIPRTLKYATTS